jgi:epsilon-lactone hydrolase
VILVSSISKRASIVKKALKVSSFVGTTPTIENLPKKRENFVKLGHKMRPEKGTKVSRTEIAGVDVDVITNCGSPKRIILYIHGGGFVYGGNQVHMHMLSVLSRLANATVYAVDYSVSPEHQFPVARDEVIAVFQELLKDNKEIFMVGDSAGGSLVLTTMNKLRDDNEKLPTKAVLISPATDASLTNEWFEANASIDPLISKEKLEFFVNAYIGDRERKHPSYSPLYADLHGLPPILFHVGSDEVMFGDSFLTHEKILKSGGKSELYVGNGLWHVWHLHTKYIPEARTAVQHIADFIAK